MRFQYLCTSFVLHRHTLCSWPRLPQGQGLAASTSWKEAGNHKVDDTLAIVTFSSSTGSRSAWSRLFLNSGASSRNKTPLCASETSPGLGTAPPPITPSLLAVWCGIRKGGWVIKPALGGNSPAAE